MLIRCLGALMNRLQTFVTAAATLSTSLFLGAMSLADTQCVPLHDGVEYRAYLPDDKRFIYVDIKVLAGVYPSVFLIADKNYETAPVQIASNDPMNRWWVDRSRPFQFSRNTLRVRWKEGHTFDFVTDLFSESDPKEIVQPIRFLDKQGDHFAGTGDTDTNTFAFQTRLEMTGFEDSYFEVAAPAVTFDGVTVTPPIAKFERDGQTVTTKCADGAAAAQR